MIRVATGCYSNAIAVDWVGPLILCREEIERIPDQIPGVYLLHTFSPHLGYYPAIYAGKTTDFISRLIQHMETPTTSSDIRTVRQQFRMYFTAAPVLDRKLRDSVEAGLIGLLRPKCNRQVPRVHPIYPNLPPLALNFYERNQ